MKIESLLLSTTIVRTMSGEQSLMNAAGFFFARDSVHASRMDVSSRDPDQDERLDLNVAWYADVLLTLTGAPKCASTPRDL